jgi:hypothetical protein
MGVIRRKLPMQGPDTEAMVVWLNENERFRLKFEDAIGAMASR